MNVVVFAETSFVLELALGERGGIAERLVQLTSQAGFELCLPGSAFIEAHYRNRGVRQLRNDDVRRLTAAHRNKLSASLTAHTEATAKLTELDIAFGIASAVEHDSLANAVSRLWTCSSVVAPVAADYVESRNLEALLTGEMDALNCAVILRVAQGHGADRKLLLAHDGGLRASLVRERFKAAGVDQVPNTADLLAKLSALGIQPTPS